MNRVDFISNTCAFPGVRVRVRVIAVYLCLFTAAASWLTQNYFAFVTPFTYK